MESTGSIRYIFKSRKLKKPAKEEARLPAFAGFIML
jgi:hypothetical protein